MFKYEFIEKVSSFIIDDSFLIFYLIFLLLFIKGQFL